MSFPDLRAYINWLDECGEVVRIKESVSTKFDIARHEEEHDGKKTVYFENVAGFDMPVVGNIFNNRRNIASVLGVKPDQELSHRIIEASKNPIPTKLVNAAPLKDIRIPESDVDLTKQIPNPMHFEGDVGHYISSGVIVARDPQSGKRNLSFARMLIKDGKTIVLMVNLYRHLAEIHRRNEKLGKDTEVAIAIGVDPVTWLEGAMPDRIVPIDVDELEVAGALRGEALEVVKCDTIDLEVPANAEIVIEGVILNGAREEEGPYGDYSRVYDGPPRLNPVIKVKGITRRKDAIYLDCLPGSFDNWLLGGVCREADILQHLQKTMPNVNAVCLPEGGCCRFHAVVQISKKFESDSMSAIIGALGPTEASRDVKWVIVVDDDIDPFDPIRVQWAVATRSQWDRDLILVPRMPMALDPSAITRTPEPIRKMGDVLSTKAGLDATIPFDQPDKMQHFRRVSVPPAVKAQAK
ncbi:MAG: UbiD family decarboxylase [Xanthobacteraceae bacterium]|nr:UbiD family decarboxylase [Xanthobacteraceae bacterium]MCW5675397.1 UbiD family decarboxylase [Xanthobacteraceae bacterium]